MPDKIVFYLRWCYSHAAWQCAEEHPKMLHRKYSTSDSNWIKKLDKKYLIQTV